MTKMAKPSTTTGFVIGRAAFAKISAVEGVALTQDSRKMFEDFDRQDLSADQRRAAIIAKHSTPSVTKVRDTVKR